MAVKTFEREVKKLSGEFKNLIENYNFEEYDFHSIRQTLQDYIQQSYPNYNDYFRSDYVMMLIELFAFYGEMMAYRMDVNMNEAFLSTAKQRKNIVKIADMLGYKFNRIEPAVSINKIDISDEIRGSRLVSKVKKQGSLNDVLSKTQNISFELVESNKSNYYPFKLDFLLKNVTAEEFLNTLNNIFAKLEDFSDTENIKTKRVIENNFEYYERSIFVDKFQLRTETNHNVYVEYAGSNKMYEVQNLLFDSYMYLNSEDTQDALTYNPDNLYSETVECGFEFVIKYDSGNNILDKNVFMYMPLVQGGTFTRPIHFNTPVKNFRTVMYEKNIFNNKTVIRQYDAQDNLIRSYYEVDNLHNHFHKYAYEVNNTQDGHIELIFGDGKNSEILIPAAKTLLFYRKNLNNSDEVMNVKNALLKHIQLPIKYYDSNVGQTQSTSIDLELADTFNAYNGLEAESDEQIKFMSRKLRSIQDRFVTGSDYETAGMLHPRVKYTSVILRSYIGKNSSRLSNEYLDVYFDHSKNAIEVFKIYDEISKVTSTFIMSPNAYFTMSTIPDKFDTIKFVSSGLTYYFDIFDPEEVPSNEWFKYPEALISTKNKGTILKLVNIKPDSNIINKLNFNNLNNILPMDYKISELTYIDSTNNKLIYKLETEFTIDYETVDNTINDTVDTILKKINSVFDSIIITNVKLMKVSDKIFNLYLHYNTEIMEIPTDDLSYIWTHYKSDDIYLNPSKSNIIEIYVTGTSKDLKKNIELYKPLSSSEINKLIRDIDKRKMISDVVNVYNSSIYEIVVALKIYKTKTSYITAELLRSKVGNVIDLFFDISNIPLGKHFHLSKLIEWLHKHIPEIEHIGLIQENNIDITPSSTMDILMDKITYTQIVEKTQTINDVSTPVRIIEIIS